MSVGRIFLGLFLLFLLLGLVVVSIVLWLRLRNLRREYTALQQALSAKSDFLSRMSHDMRTPLNAVIGLTALAMDTPGNPPETQASLGQIASSGQFLLELTNDVLDMARIERGEFELHPAPYTCAEFSESINALIPPLCREKSLHFSFLIPADCPPIFVDRVRFNQIFFNLLSNAVKYTPENGEVEFRVTGERLPDGRLSMDFIVRDTGIGMSEEFQQHLFDAFSRECTAYTSCMQGSGLGLSIAKTIVDLMGGVLEVQSVLGQGSTFHVHLDLLTAQAPYAAEEVPVVPGMLAGRTVLLAEDHPVNAMVACRLLEREGVHVDHAENGRIALERFRQSQPGHYDAVLMDIRMPEMDGLTAARSIRALPRPDAHTVPILAMTANAFDTDVRQALAAGMNAHLAKPIDPARLYAELFRQMSKSA